MKQMYISPEMELVKLSSEDILEGSDNEVFVNGEDIFAD